jgi:hypothetical protein
MAYQGKERLDLRGVGRRLKFGASLHHCISSKFISNQGIHNVFKAELEDHPIHKIGTLLASGLPQPQCD